ncbi:MAG: CaiB/BaiF CoA-transferase family protein [Myxococcota bacterium]
MAEATPQLEGISVLNLASVGPAARAARTLADYGARIIQISPTPKKGTKQIQPPFHSYAAGRGFERIQIDLKSEAGRGAFLRLASAADVVIESYRPGVVGRLGIDFEDLRGVNDEIIYCSTSGYGQDGPAASWAGHDINYQAMSGLLACTEPRKDGGPPVPGATVADSAGGGMQAVVAILAALVRRSRGGGAQYLDVSATEGMLSLMALAIDQYLATGEVAGPRQVLLTGRYAFYDLYRCRDGKWISVGAIEPHFYKALCDALGLSEYVSDQMNDHKQDEIRAAFQRVFLEKSRDEWVADLAEKNTCVAPVYEIPELVEAPHFRQRRVFMEAEHPEEGRFRQVGPILAGGIRDQPVYPVRSFDQSDAPEVLAWAGYEEAEIEALCRAGAVG